MWRGPGGEDRVGKVLNRPSHCPCRKEKRPDVHARSELYTPPLGQIPAHGFAVTDRGWEDRGPTSSCRSLSPTAGEIARRQFSVVWLRLPGGASGADLLFQIISHGRSRCLTSPPAPADEGRQAPHALERMMLQRRRGRPGSRLAWVWGTPDGVLAPCSSSSTLRSCSFRSRGSSSRKSTDITKQGPLPGASLVAQWLKCLPAMQET